MKRRIAIGVIILALGLAINYFSELMVYGLYQIADMPIILASTLISTFRYIGSGIVIFGTGFSLTYLIRWAITLLPNEESEETEKLKKVVEKAENLAEQSTKGEIDLQKTLIDMRDVGLGLQEFVNAYLTGHIQNVTKVAILSDILDLLMVEPINLLTLAGHRAELTEYDKILAKQLENPQLWGARFKTKLIEQLTEAQIFAKQQADLFEAEADGQRAIIAGASQRIDELQIKETKERAGIATYGLLTVLKQTEEAMGHIQLIQPQKQFGQTARGAITGRLGQLPSLFLGDSGEEQIVIQAQPGKTAVRMDQLRGRLNREEETAQGLHNLQ